MTTTIRVARGLCSPLRDDVLTALNPFGFKEGEQLQIDAWGEGHGHSEGRRRGARRRAAASIEAMGGD